jgi:hypothetical protein
VTLVDIGQSLGLVKFSDDGASYVTTADSRAKLTLASSTAIPPEVSWAPSDLTDLFLWYDADDADTFSFSSGTTVSEWRDKSGNARHLTAGSAERTGSINSKTTVVFNGNGHYLSANIGLSGAITKPFTILAVARCSLTTPFQRDLAGFISGGNGTKVGDGRIYRQAGNAIAIFQGGVITNGTWGTSLRSTVAYFNGANSGLSVDGGAFTTGNAGSGNAAGIFRVGHYGTGNSLTPSSPFEYWVGDVCEIAVMEAQITNDELTSWTSYVTEKWGL